MMKTLLIFLTIFLVLPSKDGAQNISDDGCGLVKVAQPYIVGGSDAKPGQNPWMISLVYMGIAHICGATIIDKRWVLTAAHCFRSSTNPNFWTGRAGRNHVSEYEDNAEDYEFKWVIIHEGYQVDPVRNDIAMLKTRKPINLINPYINRVCLPPINPYKVDAKTARISGWGDLKNVTGKNMPKIMQQGEVEIRPGGSACSESYGSDRYRDDEQICAIGNTTAACSGDSGGPLLVRNDQGAFVQVGISSFVSNSGCLSKHPNVFTRVSAHLDWIKETMALGDYPDEN